MNDSLNKLSARDAERRGESRKKNSRFVFYAVTAIILVASAIFLYKKRENAR